MANSFENLANKAELAVEGIINKVKELDATLLATSQNLNKISQTLAKNPSTQNNQNQQQMQEIAKLKVTVASLEQQINRLREAKVRLNAQTAEEIGNQRALTRNVNLEAQAQGKLLGAYANLLAQQRKARQVYRDLIVSKGKDNAATKQAEVAYKNLTARVNQANAATSNFAKSGLGNAIMGFKNLLGAFGLAGGIYMFADFSRAVIKTIKDLDQLNYTLQQVIKNEGELIRTKQFLIEMSLKYGAELLSTTNRYIKFQVAARNAGLELKATERIFETFTEASALLGLKTDELTGIYLALEQMLSKGKVTTEELRRQLGERLPGAFDLMAKALNVTSSELDKMLKAGEVLSKDALPKLTEEIRDFYGLTSEGVNTLQTSTQKLSSSWQLLIEAMNNSTGVGKLWQGILDGLAVTMQSLTNAIAGQENISRTNYFAEYFTELQDSMTMTAEDAKKTLENIRGVIKEEEAKLQELEDGMFTWTWDLKAQQEIVGMYKGQADALREYIDILEGSRKEIILNILKLKDEKNVLEEGIDLVDLKKMSMQELQEVYKRLQDMVVNNNELEEGTVNWYKQEIKFLEEKRDQLSKTSEEYQEYNKQILELKKALELITGSNKKGNLSQKDVNNAIKGTVSWYQKEISLLKKKRDETAKTSEEYNSYNEKIKELESSIRSLIRETLKPIQIKIQGIGISGDTAEQAKNINSLQIIKQLIDEQIKEFEELADTVPKGTKAYKDFIKQIENLIKLRDELNDPSIKLFEESLASQNKLLEDQEKRAKAAEDALKRLQQMTSNFLRSFSTDVLSEGGFDTLNELLLMDENGITFFEAMIKGAETSAEKFGIAFTSITEVAQEAFNFLNQAQEAHFEKQFARLEKEKEIALQFAGESATAREEIERQYEERRRALQQKQAKAQRDQAIFNILINTAQGVVAALTSTPPNVPLSIAVGLIGAAQLAMVKSTQIPEFYKGTMNAPEGWALVDERRPEIHTDKKGNIKSFGEQRANYRYLERGDRIYKSHEDYFNKELSQIMSVNNILPFQEAMSLKSPIVNIESNGLSKTEFVNQIQSLKQVIQSKEGVEINIDKNGVQTNFKRQGANIESLNNTLRLKRRIV